MTRVHEIIIIIYNIIVRTIYYDIIINLGWVYIIRCNRRRTRRDERLIIIIITAGSTYDNNNYNRRAGSLLARARNGYIHVGGIFRINFSEILIRATDSGTTSHRVSTRLVRCIVTKIMIIIIYRVPSPPRHPLTTR